MSFDLNCLATIELIKGLARKLTGIKRRAFEAEITQAHLGGSARQAETVFGWSRRTVTLGLHEQRTQIRCVERFADRGRRRTEVDDPSLVEAMHRLAQPHSHVDPQFKTPFLYTRMTAAAMRQALVEQAGYAAEALPSVRTISAIMNRLGYRLRTVQKCRPAKKIKATNAIFANVHQANQAADATPDTLRISIDCKATVDLGDYSRGGQARGQQPVAALDHDLGTKKKSPPRGFCSPRPGN